MNNRARQARAYQRAHGVSRREAFEAIDRARAVHDWLWFIAFDDPFAEFEDPDESLHEHLLAHAEAGMSFEAAPGTDEFVRTLSAAPDPKVLRRLPFGFSPADDYLYPAHALKLLLVTPVGSVGDKVTYRIDAVHSAADVYAAPGSRLRALYDQFNSSVWREAAKNPAEIYRYSLIDGLGEPVYTEGGDEGDAYSTAKRLAERAAARVAPEQLHPGSCTTPDVLFHALVARGAWDNEWTPSEYQRISGRYAAAFGEPLDLRDGPDGNPLSPAQIPNNNLATKPTTEAQEGDHPMTIESYATSKSITVEILEDHGVSQDKDGRPTHSYNLQVCNGATGRTLNTSWFAGTAAASPDAEPERVLEDLIIEASNAQTFDTFESWASNYGIEDGLSEARRDYANERKKLPRVIEFLGGQEEFDRVVELL